MSLLKKKSPFSGHKTSDAEFRVLEEQFKAKSKILSGVIDDITHFLVSVDKMLTDQRTIVTNIKQIAPESTAFGTLIKQEHDTVCSLIDDRRKTFDAEIKLKVTEPYHAYMVQYREIKERIKERHRREDAMKKHTENAAKFRSKQDVRANSEQARLDAAIPAYEELNAELKRDINILLNDADKFFTPLMATLFSIQTNFYCHLHNKKSANMATMDPQLFNMPPFKSSITPRDQSSVSKQYMAASNPYGENSPYASPPTQAKPAGQPAPQYSSPTPQYPNHYAQPAYGGAPGSYSPVPVAHHQPLPQPPVQPPLPPPPMNNRLAQGLWDFNASAAHELSFRAGDVLSILDSSGSWWKAEFQGRQGVIPGNYVKLI
eukprot:TRINITY_DN4335_c0_g1_i1.p1 TRINITY_DN4335_c0_g1~~TRINITY_DN4335_c0_g1_i1.p1  ORF type:complete len:374 (+),score=92.04 TRINITY_DN4335_c0_g1_i1:265-1386(+)